MIIIKGDLIIDKSRRGPLLSMILLDQIQKRTSPVYDPIGSNPEEIIAVADLDTFDTSDAIVINKSVIVSDTDVNDKILVTGDVILLEGGDE